MARVMKREGSAKFAFCECLVCGFWWGSEMVVNGEGGDGWVCIGRVLKGYITYLGSREGFSDLRIG